MKKFICTVCGYVYEGDELLNFARNVNNLVQNSKKLLNQMNLIL